MNGNNPTYKDLCDIAPMAFDLAMEKRGMNEQQAFSFMYEHFGIFIDGDDPWVRLLALTAVFKTGASKRVRLEDGLFAEDVLYVLRGSYTKEASQEFSRHAGAPDLEILQNDMEIVKKEYLAM